MPTRITLQTIWENGYSYILISFPYDDPDLFRKIAKFPKANWDPKLKVWKIPFSEARFSEFIVANGERIDSDLDIFLVPLKTELIRRNYSRKTQKTYLLFNKAFLRTIGKHPYEVKEADIRGYLDDIHYKQKLAPVSVRSIIQAIKFYYKNVIGKDVLRSYSLPKREKRIPESLSRQEVNKILHSLSNPKHRLLLQLCYGSGLRVSELIALRGVDIDWERKSIRVRQGKGKKDRFTLLPEFCKTELCSVLQKQGHRNWIFSGMIPGKHLSVRAAEKIFTNAKSKASVAKDVSIHDLRHAFAIHLLESGTSIKLIQRLLGHASVRTTEIYARITDPSVAKIRSPLDMA